MSELLAALIGAVLGGLLTAHTSRQLLYESVEISRRERLQEQRQQSEAIIEAVRAELELNIWILQHMNDLDLAPLSHFAMQTSKQHLHKISSESRQFVFDAEASIYQYNSVAQILRDRMSSGSDAVHVLREKLNMVATASLEANERALNALSNNATESETANVGTNSE